MHDEPTDFCHYPTKPSLVFVTNHESSNCDAAILRLDANSCDVVTDSQDSSVTSYSNSLPSPTLLGRDSNFRDDVTEVFDDLVTSHDSSREPDGRRSPGRPRKPGALSDAERSRNYRARRKARSAELRNPDIPLSSKIIDLSALPAWRRK
jgi:hypothetical protein